MQQIFPTLISTTSATALTPNGTLGLNYIGLISPIVSAIQALSTEMQNLVATVQGFAQSFSSETITATNELCVNKSDGTPVCITGDQLASLLAGNGNGSNQSPSGAQQSQTATSSLPESVTSSAGSNPAQNPPVSVTSPASSTTPESVTSTTTGDTTPDTQPDSPPIIQINGDNPAYINEGDSYADLGATVSDTGPGQAGDTNLGLKTFLNGTLVSNIVIDTSAVATDTIDYVATDDNGLIATSTRTVIIEAVASSTSQ